ncbi:acyltransferase [Synechocystis sp. PCC 7509]|uniref:acyltransferase n=1 Tax=Synechocystis sp. PCC 7509 TaxID=927677 RepID=UPI0002ACC421|nr:acyltransferase [Synechocystis sp. PCC 7509]
MTDSSITLPRGSIIDKIVQRAKNKSLIEIIKLVIFKLILIKYRWQYPQVTFGAGVKIKGAFSVEGKGKVVIGDYCSFVATKNLPNKITVRDSSACVSIGSHCSIAGSIIALEGKGSIKIGNDCHFANYYGVQNIITSRGNAGFITVGNHCYFNGTNILSESSIDLEKLCMVSDALIMDTDAHSIEINRWSPKAITKTKPIYINENVWIASKSAVLKGVKIGRNSIVGLGTIVRQSVPENVVVIGNPQQIVKHLDSTVLPYEFPT